MDPADVTLHHTGPVGSRCARPRLPVRERSRPSCGSPSAARSELHAPQWRIDRADGAPLPPDRLVIDLDPALLPGSTSAARWRSWPATCSPATARGLGRHERIQGDAALRRPAAHDAARTRPPRPRRLDQRTTRAASPRRWSERPADLVVSVMAKDLRPARCSSTGARTTRRRRPSCRGPCAAGRDRRPPHRHLGRGRAGVAAHARRGARRRSRERLIPPFLRPSDASVALFQACGTHPPTPRFFQVCADNVRRTRTTSGSWCAMTLFSRWRRKVRSWTTARRALDPLGSVAPPDAAPTPIPPCGPVAAGAAASLAVTLLPLTAAQRCRRRRSGRQRVHRDAGRPGVHPQADQDRRAALTLDRRDGAARGPNPDPVGDPRLLPVDGRPGPGPDPRLPDVVRPAHRRRWRATTSCAPDRTRARLPRRAARSAPRTCRSRG